MTRGAEMLVPAGERQPLLKRDRRQPLLPAAVAAAAGQVTGRHRPLLEPAAVADAAQQAAADAVAGEATNSAASGGMTPKKPQPLLLEPAAAGAAAEAAVERARARPRRWLGGLSEELYGYALMALSSFAFSLMTLVVRVLGAPTVGIRVPVLVTVWFRSVIQLAASSAYIACFVDYSALLAEMSPVLSVLLLLRGVFGSLGIICLFSAISILPLGDAITLFFLGPIFTIFGTHVALGEPVSTVEGIAAMVSFVGVALVAKAGASGSDALSRSGAELLAPRPLGILLALSAAMLSAAAYTIVRKMNSGVHFMFSVFSLGLTSTVITSLAIRMSIIGFLSDLAGRKVTGALLILQGIAAFAGQCALNKGLQHCRGVGVLIRNIDVPLAYLFGIAVLGEVPSIASCVGATLVFGSVVGLTVRQSLRS